MRDKRGITIIEVLVTTLAAGFVLLGVGSLYVATTRAFAESTSQASLQRQGTLALQELGKRIRSGVGSPAITSACNGQASSVQVTTVDYGTLCYYAGGTGTADEGKLCEYLVGGGAGCRDLLYGALQPRIPFSTPIRVLIQPAPPSPSCPAGVAASRPCFAGTVGLDGTLAQFQFTITDGLTVMPFDITLTCSGRNC